MRVSEASDVIMMRRCITLAQSARQNGEYPFAAVISRRGEFICESLNLVKLEGDVTRHAEMHAISTAQRKLRSTSLHDCTLYSTVEPCAMCSYAIRETRIRRVVFSLRSPVMGGNTRWKILGDDHLSSRLPEVFAPVPEVLSGYMQNEVQKVFQKRSPLAWEFIKAREIFTECPGIDRAQQPKMGRAVWSGLANWARASILDRIWRG
jgi:tRNA(adenine34) deaminase